MSEWMELDDREYLNVRYRHTDPDHFGREHEINVGYDGIYITNAEALAFARQLPEVKALVEAIRQHLYSDAPHTALESALAPFEDIPDD